MDKLAQIISQLPPELIKANGRQATVIMLDGSEESVYHLARRNNYHVVSKEPYTALKQFRDIELIAASEVREIVFHT